MSNYEAWIGNCFFLKDGNDAQVSARVAVWTDSEAVFKKRLDEYASSIGYKFLWVEECLRALDYLNRYGHHPQIGGLVRAVHANHLVEIGPFEGDEEEVPELSFREALLALDYKTSPVFAVLDGAQFDNLPEALFEGDFISKSLYLDRGDNNSEQVITAPHMVTLDERSEKITGRSYEDTVEALLKLIDNKPAAVFWQCPEGKEKLYKHLRSINMVLFPKEALDDWVEPEAEADEQGHIPEPDTHTPVTFRHADANVMAQVLPVMPDDELSRLFGPAASIHYAPEPEWLEGKEWSFSMKNSQWQNPQKGMLRISVITVEKMGYLQISSSRENIKKYLKEAVPEYAEKMPKKDLDDLIIKSEKTGEELGFTNEYTLGLWALITLITGQQLLDNQHVISYFKNNDRSSDELIEEVVDQIANASDSDLEALL